MPRNPNSLKEYLVTLGWEIDTSSFVKAQSVSDKLKGIFVKDGHATAAAWVGAFAVMAAAVVAVNKTMEKLIEKEAEHDEMIEKKARKYWAAEQNVRSYTLALEALNETESDLFYMTDEQYGRFKQLYEIGKTLEPPKEVDEFLTKVRDIRFEFQKLGFYADYVRRYVVYFLGQMVGGDAEKVRQFLNNITEFIRKNVPKISEQIAKLFNVFYRLARTVLLMIGKIIKIGYELLSSIDANVYKIGLALLALWKIMTMSPIGMVITLLTVLLLLIDDYMGWKEGIDSALDWSKYDEAIQSFLNTIKEFWDMLLEIVDTTSKLSGGLLNVFNVLNDITGLPVKEFVSSVLSLLLMVFGVTTGNPALIALGAGLAFGNMSALSKWKPEGYWIDQSRQDKQVQSVIRSWTPQSTSADEIDAMYQRIYEAQKYAYETIGHADPYITSGSGISNQSNLTINNTFNIDDRTGNPNVTSDKVVDKIYESMDSHNPWN